MKYTSPSLTINDQLHLLISRGLIIADTAAAETFLSNTSFYRFKRYGSYFEEITPSGRNYKVGTRIEQIFYLYNFDKDLRMIVFEAIEKIENAFKSKLTNHLSIVHGTHWYLDRNAFDRIFNHEEFIFQLRRQCQEEDEAFIKEYNSNYSDPELPPSWMIMEILSFGKISRMFEGLALPNERQKICDELGAIHRHLTSWLRSFTWVRNVCAHHGRLWNRYVPFEPQFPQRAAKKFLQQEEFPKNKIYATLCCMQKVMEVIEPVPTFKPNLKQLLHRYPEINRTAMGFPEKWDSEKLWS